EALVVEVGHLRRREDVGHDFLVLWTAERVDLGGAEAGLGQYALRVLPESCDLGTALQWRTRETERWRRRLISAGAVLDGAERAAMRDLRVLQRLVHGEIGRAGHAVLFQGRHALLDRESLGPGLELVDELVPVHAAVGVLLETRIAQPVAAAGGRRH